MLSPQRERVKTRLLGKQGATGAGDQYDKAGPSALAAEPSLITQDEANSPCPEPGGI
jgi:hypothetical protein